MGGEFYAHGGPSIEDHLPLVYIGIGNKKYFVPEDQVRADPELSTFFTKFPFWNENYARNHIKIIQSIKSEN